MSSIGTRVDDKTRFDVRTIDFQQTVADPQTTSVFNQFGNTIVVKFPYPQNFSRAEVALTEIFLFYSWYNISAAFGNNIFSYAFPTASGYLTFNVTIPDGFYSIDELSEFFQTVQVTNGTYVTATGDPSLTPITFLSWTANSVYYRTTIISSPVPAAGDAAFTTPANFPGGGRSATAQDPSLIISPTPYAAGSDTPGFYSFSKTLGISPGTYPALGTTTAVTINGQFAPVIESTNVVNVEVDLVYNGSLNPNPKIIAKFTPTVAFGEQISYTPFFPQYLPAADGTYPQVVIRLLDENNVPLNIQDPHVSGRLLVRGG